MVTQNTPCPGCNHTRADCTCTKTSTTNKGCKCKELADLVNKAYNIVAVWDAKGGFNQRWQKRWLAKAEDLTKTKGE